jgi:hypothetical protein
MNRRTFVQTAGFLATSLSAQTQPPSPAKAGIKTTLMLEMLKGSIEEEFELAARAGCQSVESLTQHASLVGCRHRGRQAGGRPGCRRKAHSAG